MRALWEAAYRANDRAHWLALSDYLDENGHPSVAAALRQAAEATSSEEGLSPEELLPLAAEAGQGPIVQRLLERGVRHYNHAQRAAVRAGQTEVLRLLLEDAVRIVGQGRLVLHEALGAIDPHTYDMMTVDWRPEDEPVWEAEALVDAAKAGQKG